MQSEPLTVKSLKTFAKNALKTLYQDKERDSLIHLLFENYLGYSKIDCITMSDELVDPSIAQKIKYAVQKLQYHIPIQYIIGKAHFFDREFYTDKNVLIPRMETEELVHWILSDLKGNQKDKEKIKIIDIGTGSGCIAITLKKNIDFAEITAVDVSEKAIKVAKKNAEFHSADIKFLNHNILGNFSNIYFEKFDIIVSNPPYIEEKDKRIIRKNVLDFEPHLALFVPDDDPLLFYKSIIEFSLYNLNKNGKLYFEINEKFGKEIVSILKERGFKNIILKKDINNKDRMISAKM